TATARAAGVPEVRAAGRLLVLHDRVLGVYLEQRDLVMEARAATAARADLERAQALRAELGVEAAGAVGTHLQLRGRRRLERRGDVRVGREPIAQSPHRTD